MANLQDNSHDNVKTSIKRNTPFLCRFLDQAKILIHSPLCKEKEKEKDNRSEQEPFFTLRHCVQTYLIEASTSKPSCEITLIS